MLDVGRGRVIGGGSIGIRFSYLALTADRTMRAGEEAAREQEAVARPVARRSVREREGRKRERKGESRRDDCWRRGSWPGCERAQKAVWHSTTRVFGGLVERCQGSRRRQAHDSSSDFACNAALAGFGKRNTDCGASWRRGSV